MKIVWNDELFIDWDEILDKLKELSKKEQGKSFIIKELSSEMLLKVQQGIYARSERYAGLVVKTKIKSYGLVVINYCLVGNKSEEAATKIEVVPEEELPLKGDRSTVLHNDIMMIQQHHEGLHMPGTKNDCLECLPIIMARMIANHNAGGHTKRRVRTCPECYPEFKEFVNQRNERVQKQKHKEQE